MKNGLETNHLGRRISLSQAILDSDPGATAVEMNLKLRASLESLLSRTVFVRLDGRVIRATCTGVMTSKNPGGSISVEIPGVKDVVKIDPTDIMVHDYASESLQ